MPEHGRVQAPTTPVDGPCVVPACPVCAVAAVPQRPLTVAEWLAARLRPARVRAQQRRRDHLAGQRAGKPATTAGRWPYSSWWDESCG